MKIRKGMEEKYSQWLEKRKREPCGYLLIITLHSVGDYLDENRAAKDTLEMIAQLKRYEVPIEDRVQIALAISIFSERGSEFRFEWNKYYMGEDWALNMEISEKRLHNPA